MKLDKKYFLAVLSLLGFQIAFGMSPSLAAMDSKDWADLFEIADTVLNDKSNTNANSGSNISYISINQHIQSFNEQIENGNFRVTPCSETHEAYCSTAIKAGSDLPHCRGNSKSGLEQLLKVNIGDTNNSFKKLDKNTEEKRSSNSYEIATHGEHNVHRTSGMARKNFESCQTALKIYLYDCGMKFWDPTNYYKNFSSNAQSMCRDGGKRLFPGLSNNQISQTGSDVSNNQSSSSNSTSSNQPNQQNSSPEEVERSNMKSNYAEKTAAYEQKYQGRGKKHNLDAAANRCIKTKGRKVLNTCNFDVEVVFCAENPDPNSKHAFEMANGFDCARNAKGMWGISANSELMGVFTAESVSVFACKKPSLPGAEYDHQKKTLVGRCSEY